MKYGRVRLVAVLALVLALGGTLAYAQGTVTTTLSGTVVDSSGGVIPGADVTVKNNATGGVHNAVTGADGGFVIPAMPPGTYTVTIALMGFKTWSSPDVVLNAATPASIKATLEVGKLEETVVVEGAAQLVQTQTSAVASTLNVKAITNLPLPGRDAFGFVALTPGVTTSDGSLRDATVNGLPQSVTNITLDGMNIQDNYAKTWDGMFTRVSPRLDAVEEVTIGTAAQGADMAGQGAVQIKFVTRSGTNQYKGSLYYYFRRDWMNTNTWFNLNRNVKTDGTPGAKPVLAQYQPGGRIGGPIIIPGLFDGHDKAFFFINYEWVRSPGTNNANRTVLTPSAAQGLFQYSKGSVDLLQLAAKNGQTATIDPQVAKLLADVQASTTQGALNATSDPMVQTLNWQQPTKSTTKYPTIRLDYNLSSKHRLSASLTQNHLVSDPDTTNSVQRTFPGFPVHGLQDSYRWTSQLSLRSTLTSNMVNELRLGGTGGATLFSPDLVPDMFNASGAGAMNGFAIGLSQGGPSNTVRNLSNPYPSSTNSAREGSTRMIEDTLSWIKGAHSIATGFGYTQANVWLRNQQIAPTLSFGMASNDPANGMFSNTNFPGASGNDLLNAQALYALLTGRITTIGYNARIAEDGTQYVVNGPSLAKGRLPNIDVFVQDAWRWKPYLTVNAGLRYALQKPFFALNNSYSMATMDDLFGVTGVGSNYVPGSTVTNLGNLFTPGVNASAPTYKLLSQNTPAYKTDTNNFAPSIGVALKVGSDSGLRNKLLGNDAVLRAGFNIAYQRGGMSDFTEVFGTNPGLSITSPTRSETNGNLGTVPVLLRNGNLGPGAFGATRTYPMPVPSASSNIDVFDPNIKVPWASSYTVGLQRAITKSMMGEVRFIHTGSHGTWTLNNVSQSIYMNQVNILSNGFLNEFKLAQANLVANQGKSFAYMGAGTGTSPLPIMLAYLNGKPSSQAGTASAYSGSGWANSSLMTYLYQLGPNPQQFAQTLRMTSTYTKNAGTAGLPANFFVANPDVTHAYLVTNGQDTRYNGVQLILNRRFAQGLQVSANYAFGRGYQYSYYGFDKPYVETLQNYSNSAAGGGSVDHNFAASWVYELPFGQGKAIGGGVGRTLNRVIGNWSFSGTARIQSGRLLDFGNVRLVGMTPQDLQKVFNLRMATDPSNGFRTLTYMLPQDIIDNTIKAFSFTWQGYSKGTPTGRYIAPANGPSCMETGVYPQVGTGSNSNNVFYYYNNAYGDCGARSLILTGPPVIRFDMSISKDMLVTAGVGIRFEAQVFNVFNRVNYNPVGMPGTSSAVTVDNYQLTGAQDQSRTMQLAFRITW